ncbi:DUF397 domain-containing protein [Streptomyces sp. B1866]|uniref:DUF397 domain-containing protein n=1 Tax=Streptomyces sp. B1866 TaxID=3075431 RepID=UPI00288CD65B|nr:DUF397 domain-containing protein [Streptomyces sp. B1866]MDT3396321.1 DUF397 domain-containing protein [Streptomyces sp. B1866]
MTTAEGLTGVHWFTSSYSNDQGGECVEGARVEGAMAVRDSKNRTGPAFVFTADAWMTFIAAVKADGLGEG